MAEQTNEQVIGGYGPLSRSSIKALEYAAHVIGEDHKIKNGETALFWHLVSIAARHIAEDRAESDKPSRPQ